MIPQKRPTPTKPYLQNLFKLPQIFSKKNVQNINKNQPLSHQLPQINKSHKPNYLGKENISLNLIPRRNLFSKQIEARLFQVEAADRMVKHILGDPEPTVNVGDDMTNFQLKIELNRQLLKKRRKKSNFQQIDLNEPQLLNQKNLKQSKLKSFCSSQRKLQKSDFFPKKQMKKIRISQNYRIQTSLQMKKRKNRQLQDLRKLPYKSERQQKKEKNKSHENSQIFQPIKQILSHQHKLALDNQANNIKKMVKFTIEELESKLKNIKKIKSNKSYIEGSFKTSDSRIFDQKLNPIKSVGMIPLALPLTVESVSSKNWNKVEFFQQSKQTKESFFKRAKNQQSDFYQQFDHIQKLQMKSHKSIQKMVQNRKLLVDLKLLNDKTKKSAKTEQNQVMLKI